VQRFLTPISFDTLVFLFQTSWPVSTVARLWIERLNGVPNAAAASGPPRCVLPDFERFRRIAELFQSGRDQKLATVRPEERLEDVGGPLAAPAMTAAAMVEAVKNGLEYRPHDDGKSWVLVRKERRLVVDVVPAAIGHPELNDLAALLNL